MNLANARKRLWTPGPWCIKETPSGIELQCVSGGWLFKLDDGRRPSDFGSEFLETQAANLSLIAAAPELYEALEALVKWCETSDGKPFDPDDNIDKEWRMAIDAIAKVRGVK